METQNQTTNSTNPWMFAIQIGFFGGLIWGFVKMAEFYFNFTKVVPGFLVKPFLKNSLLLSWTGYVAGLLAFMLLTILAALVYVAVFRKIQGPWFGMLYGLLWWALIYLLVGPVTGMMKWINKTDFNSIITDLCLFVLWGLFIGYSIAVEFTDERIREPFKKAT